MVGNLDMLQGDPQLEILHTPQVVHMHVVHCQQGSSGRLQFVCAQVLGQPVGKFCSTFIHGPPAHLQPLHSSWLRALQHKLAHDLHAPMLLAARVLSHEA